MSAATDRAFHVALYRSLGNHLLSEVLDAFWAAFHRVVGALRADAQDPRVVRARREDILAALEAGDGPRAAVATWAYRAGIRQVLAVHVTAAP